MDILEAVRKGDVALVKALMADGVSLNIYHGTGWTPLMDAVFKMNLPLVQLLLDGGADVHAKTIYGQTAMRLAATDNNIPIIKALLRAGAEIDLSWLLDPEERKALRVEMAWAKRRFLVAMQDKLME